MKARRRLLTIGHSYCVGLNRRLPHEIARVGDWDVTAVGPARFRGDFGWHTLEPTAGELCAVVPVPVHFSRQVHVMLYGRALASLVAQRWDLVHCWEEPYVASAAQIARWMAPEVPLVLATFQNIAKQYPPPFNWIERYSMARADAVIAFGRTAADVLTSRGWGRVSVGSAATDPRSLAVIPPGVDVSQFRPDAARRLATLERLGWSAGAPVVGFVGRLVSEKGVELFTKVLDRVTTPWRALIVGSGPLEERLAAWSGRHGDRVRMVTARHDEVPAYLNAMDVLCAPSQTTPRWHEQFGRMLIEAFASGVAVIASRSGEIPYVIAEAGLLAAEDDLAEWQQAIEMLTTDRPRRLALARLGRERAESVYAWPVVARQHVDFFERVIASRARLAS